MLKNVKQKKKLKNGTGTRNAFDGAPLISRFICKILSYRLQSIYALY